MTARILCLIVLLLEIRGLSLSLSGRKWMALIFYTQLSNLVTTASSLLLLIFGQPYYVTVLRYLSTCMLVMTFFVTTCVLIPMGGDPKKLLWSGNGLFFMLLFLVSCKQQSRKECTEGGSRQHCCGPLFVSSQACECHRDSKKTA